MGIARSEVFVLFLAFSSSSFFEGGGVDVFAFLGSPPNSLYVCLFNFWVD